MKIYENGNLFGIQLIKVISFVFIMSILVPFLLWSYKYATYSPPPPTHQMIIDDSKYIVIEKKNIKHIKNCNICPEMVIVPSGEFNMGVSDKDLHEANDTKYSNILHDMTPKHTVHIKSFAIAKYDVTVSDYALFIKDTGYKSSGCKVSYITHMPRYNGFSGDASWSNPGYQQTGNFPVVCVSWVEANNYIQWLNKKSASINNGLRIHYRLPSEAEWEYAARAGTGSLVRYWGNLPTHQCEYANGLDITSKKQAYDQGNIGASCRDGYIFASPVGSFKPNQWGLYDVLGNVLQWTEDCEHLSYSGAPTDGSAWTNENLISGDCSRRMARGGGGWDAPTEFLILPERWFYKTQSREDDLGFRLAGDIIH